MVESLGTSAKAASEPRDHLDMMTGLVYHELRRLAHRYRRNERHAHTLQTTALVHEAYLRLANMGDVSWQTREQLFTLAAQAMRRILVDHARARTAQKRGSGQPLIPLDEIPPPAVEDRPEQVLAVNEALHQLGAIDPRMVQVVEMRYFVGFSIEETAEVLQVAPSTVKRDWVTARAWLFRHLQGRERRAPAPIVT